MKIIHAFHIVICICMYINVVDNLATQFSLASFEKLKSKEREKQQQQQTIETASHHLHYIISKCSLIGLGLNVYIHTSFPFP